MNTEARQSARQGIQSVEVGARLLKVLAEHNRAMMLKDLHLAADAARAAGAEIRLGEHAESIYQALSDKGLDGLDFSGVMKDVKGEIPR